MTDKYNDFDPSLIDQVVERSTEHLSARDANLVENLQQAYSHYAQINDASLRRVWGRLDERLGYKQQQGKIMPIQELRKKRERKSTMDEKAQARKARRGRLLGALSTVAAVLVVTALVSSMIIVFNAMGRNGKTGTASNIQQTVPASTPVVDSSGIYMATRKDWYTSEISKADAKTHKVLWKQMLETNMEVYGLAVYGNTLYYSGGNEGKRINFVEARDATSGSVRWTAILSKDAAGNQGAQNWSMNVLTQPTIVDGRVYVLSRMGKVTVLDANSGKNVWTYDAGMEGQMQGTIYGVEQLVMSNGVVYGAVRNKLFALEAKSGKEIWKPVMIGPDQIFGGMQIMDGALYTSSSIESQHYAGQPLTSYVYGFDAKSGAQRWRYPLSVRAGAPVVSGGKVYFEGYVPDYGDGGGHATLYALDVNGNMAWYKEFDSMGAFFLVEKGQVYISYSTNDPATGKLISSKLAALKIENGVTIWSKDVQASPRQIVNGVLYVGQAPRQIAAYDLKKGDMLWHEQYGVDLIDKMGRHDQNPPLFVAVP